MFKEQWGKGSIEYGLLAKGERKEEARFIYKMNVNMDYYAKTTSMKKKIRLIRDMKKLIEKHFDEIIDQILPCNIKE